MTLTCDWPRPSQQPEQPPPNMNVTSLLNSGATATNKAATPTTPLTLLAVRVRSSDVLLDHECKESGDESSVADTASGSTAPSSTVATPATEAGTEKACVRTPTQIKMQSISEQLPQKLFQTRGPDESLSTANRNRTPWDAGGFSLALALDDTKKPQQTSADMPSTSPMDLTEKSPQAVLQRQQQHKFSDSRSSFSSTYTTMSMASTNNSVSHSRISSLSTVSENQPLSTLIADFSLLETRVSKEAPGYPPPPHHSHQHSQHSQHNQHQLKLQQYSLPGTASSSHWPRNPSSFQSGIPSDHELESPMPIRARHEVSTIALPARSQRSPTRVQSPSDAVLIPRAPTAPDDSSLDGAASTRLHISPIKPQESTHPGTRNLQVSSSPSSRRHKRAVSAPDLSSANATSAFNPRFPTFGPIPEPTPSPSQDSDENAMDNDMASSSPPEDDGLINLGRTGGRVVPGIRTDSEWPSPSCISSSPLRGYSPPPSKTEQTPYNHQVQQNHHFISASESAPSPATFEIASVCMYRGDCQTGSQLRKAISHIFGRNKLCTRMIPTGVWVHYCRKHYQRTRYRNGGEYPQRQIGLVQLQVRRVQAWSDANVQHGCGPILKDWSLSVRKREQLRLDNKLAAAAGKKRPFQDEAEDEDEEGYDDDRAAMSGTAVPDWVVARIGDGYSTTDILDVVDRLKAEIDQGRLQQIPDIEILPNIITNNGTAEIPSVQTASKKGYSGRRPTATRLAGNHRRSQSVNTTGMQSDATPMVRRRSQPNGFLVPPGGTSLPRMPYGAEQLPAPMEKRQRVDSEGVMHPQLGPPLGVLGNMVERPSAFGSRVQLAHRPAFAGIRETQAETMGMTFSYAGGDRHPDAIGACSYSTANGGHYAQHPAPPEVYDHVHHERHYSSGSGTSSIHEYEPRRIYDHRYSSGAYGILPAPNPQRFVGASVAQQLESSSSVLSSVATRRGAVHQRSQSEAGFLHHLSLSQLGRPTSSGGQTPSAPSFGGLSGYMTSGNSGSNTSSDNNTRHPGPMFQAQSSSQEPVQGAFPSQSAMSLIHHPGGRLDEDQRSSLANSNPSSYEYAQDDGNESYDKFENVQLPPLQSIQHSLYSQQPRRLSTVADYPAGVKHTRNQSSPTVARMLPATVEEADTLTLSEPAQVMLSSPGSN